VSQSRHRQLLGVLLTFCPADIMPPKASRASRASRAPRASRARAPRGGGPAPAAPAVPAVAAPPVMSLPLQSWSLPWPLQSLGWPWLPPALPARRLGIRHSPWCARGCRLLVTVVVILMAILMTLLRVAHVTFVLCAIFACAARSVFIFVGIP
jgi:hypothetical protein